MTLESDEALSDRAGHDSESFAELYRRYRDPLYRYCWFRLHDDASANDAVADIFVAVLEALRRTGVRRFRPWLFTIAHHEIADRQRRGKPTLELHEAAASPSGAPSPEELAILNINLDALRSAVRQLKPDQARVIELRMAGLEGPEIRQVLNRSRSWVDTTQFRALTQLRRMLAGEEAGGS
jgi:RNA polymerase sigma-70 factor (ECF subfamily)